MLDQEAAGNLVKSFHLSLTYLKIYPPTSQMVVAALDALAKVLLAATGRQESVTLSELSGKLLIDGKESESREIQLIGRNILALFAQRAVTSVTFRPGLERDELVGFVLSLLRKRREDFPELPHVALDQTVYVAMVKGEEAVVKIREMVHRAGGDIAGLITSLRESYDLIDGIPDAGGRLQAQEHLAQELARQDSTVLRDIFERELPPRIEQSGLKVQLLRALSQEKIQSIFGEISTWFDEIKKKESSDFAAIEQLEKLKHFVQTILGASAAKDMPRQFFEELIRKGLLEQLPEWFSTAPAKPATVFEVERLLEKPAADLMERETREALPTLVEKLCQIANGDLIAKLLEKLLENVRHPAPKIRLPAAQSIAAVYAVLQAQNREPLLRFLELPLLEAAHGETSADIHRILADVLCQRVRQDLLHGEHELALRIVDLFCLHSSPEAAGDARIAADTAAAFERLIPEIIEILITDIKSDNDKKRLGSLQILTRTGDRAIEPLICVIKESNDVRSRRLAVLALQQFGERARRRFAEELNLGLIAEEMQRVIEAAADLGGPELLEELGCLLRYPDPSVKKEIMKLLARFATAPAKVMLIEQLKDRDPGIVAEAVRLLGEMRCTEAVPALILLIATKRSSNDLRERICVALGNIGDIRAVPVLVERLLKKPSLFCRNNSDFERVRLRAAWSLRRFSLPEAEQALAAAAGEKSEALSMTAKESLAVLQKNRPAQDKPL